MDLTVTGAKIYFTIPGINYPVTQTVVSAWIVMIIIAAICIWLTHDLQVHARTKRQVAAEYLVNLVTKLVDDNMGVKWRHYVPLIAAIFSMSVVASMLSLTGMYSPNNDLNTFLAWSVLVFVLITYYKIKVNGIGGYLKSFTQPIFVMTPLNIIGEIATPVSMAFRHFGNALSGYVIGLLLYGALASLSETVLAWLPGSLATIPVLQIGIPAVLNVYFTVFSGVVQPFIYCMLTMLYIADAGATEEA